jgi:Flp pilus assembly protein TadD
VLRPDSDFAFAHLAAVLAKAGRVEDARAACLKALSLDPDNALARQTFDLLGKR